MSKSWLSGKVQVQDTADGKRLVATQKIADDEQITRNGDDRTLMMTDVEFQEFAREHTYKDAITVTGGFKRVTVSLDAADPSNLAIRTSQPNAYNDGDGLIAIRDIEPGEEITIAS